MLSSLYSTFFDATQSNNNTPVNENPPTPEGIADLSTSQESSETLNIQKSTRVDSTSVSIKSPEFSSISTFSSPDVSPIKNNRDNGMYETSSSFSDSHHSIHTNIENIDYTNKDTQKSMFVYFLEKNRLHLVCHQNLGHRAFDLQELQATNPLLK